MTKMMQKHSGPIKWIGTLLIPTVLISFWLGVGSLLGQDAPPNVSGIASPEAALPTIGTSLTAGGVFYLVMAFLQRTIDRYEAEKKEINAQWKALMDSASIKSDNIITLAYRDRDAWASKYHEMVADVMDDTKSLRLAQLNTPHPPRRQT
jgi:hypothetical protein